MAQTFPTPELNYFPIDITPSVSVSNAVSTPTDPQSNTPVMNLAISNLVPTGGGTVMPLGQLASSNFVSGSSGWLIAADGNAEFNDVTARGTIYASAGQIANWHINTNTLSSGTVESSSNVLIDSANSLIRLGPTSGNYLTLDGANQRIRSSNYSAGVSGFTVEANLIEAENLVARGILRGSTMQYDAISAVGGQLMVTNADVLASDMTANDNSTLTTKNTTTFSVNDILVIRAFASGSIQEEWLRVTDISAAPTYTVTRDLAGSFGANANPAWKTGTTIAKQGVSDGAAVYSGGWLRLFGQGTNSPFYSVFARNGLAYNAYVEACRLGNLNGIGSFVADTYGIFIGNFSTGKYLTYDTGSGDLVVNGYIQSSKGAFGGDGSDGALSISSGTTTIDLGNNAVVTKNYTSISITGTAKLAFTNPNTNGTAILLKSQGAVTVTSSTTPAIDASGMGAAGGAAVTALNTDTNGNTGTAGISMALTNNGGSAGKANTAVDAAAATSSTVFSRTLALAIIKYPFYFIGGGGGSGGAEDQTNAATATSGVGGVGGPFLAIECGGALNFTGNISVAGKVGGDGSYAGTRGYGTAGGGGGGGNFIMLYNSLTANSGTVTVSGGVAGTGHLVVGAGTTGNTGGVGGASGSNNSSASTHLGPNNLSLATAGADGYSLIQQNKDFP